MLGFTMGSPVSPAIQSMLGEYVSDAKAALSGGGGIKGWLFVGVAVVLVIFFVKKVSK
jgi:hypothetical protein